MLTKALKKNNQSHQVLINIIMKKGLLFPFYGSRKTLKLSSLIKRFFRDDPMWYK